MHTDKIGIDAIQSIWSFYIWQNCSAVVFLSMCIDTHTVMNLWRRIMLSTTKCIAWRLRFPFRYGTLFSHIPFYRFIDILYVFPQILRSTIFLRVDVCIQLMSLLSAAVRVFFILNSIHCNVEIMIKTLTH